MKHSMNITDYLLLPEQAVWAYEKGFDGECFAYCDRFSKETFDYTKDLSCRKSYTNKMFDTMYKHLTPNFTVIPTFDQFFDWVEEKWGVRVRIDLNLPDEGGYWIKVYSAGQESKTGKVYTGFETKRSARIAACEAIIKYVEENKL